MNSVFSVVKTDIRQIEPYSLVAFFMSEFQENCPIETITRSASDVVCITVLASQIARTACPGQFVMVRVGNGYDPLLRRPFSIHACDQKNNSISLLFKVVGQGTAMLAALAPDDSLDLIGPLGKGFSFGNTPACLVGGGMGIAPLYFLASELAARESTNDHHILLGARNREELAPFVDQFSGLGFAVQTATDDGSLGHHGFVPDLLDAITPFAGTIYTCGPHPMMENVVRKCSQLSLPCQVSLETHMACGLGACLGCTVAGKDGYVHVCKQGPVFPASEVKWTL